MRQYKNRIDRLVESAKDLLIEPQQVLTLSDHEGNLLGCFWSVWWMDCPAMQAETEEERAALGPQCPECGLAMHETIG